MSVHGSGDSAQWVSASTELKVRGSPGWRAKSLFPQVPSLACGSTRGRTQPGRAVMATGVAPPRASLFLWGTAAMLLSPQGHRQGTWARMDEHVPLNLVWVTHFTVDFQEVLRSPSKGPQAASRLTPQTPHSPTSLWGPWSPSTHALFISGGQSSSADYSCGAGMTPLACFLSPTSPGLQTPPCHPHTSSSECSAWPQSRSSGQRQG